MAFTNTDQVEGIVKEFSGVSTALVGFTHNKLQSSATPKAQFKIYTSEPDTTDTTSPRGWRWVGPNEDEYFRGPRVWKAYNSENDRDPTDRVKLRLGDDSSGVRSLASAYIASAIESSAYSGYAHNAASTVFKLCGNVASSLNGVKTGLGLCTNLAAPMSTDSSTVADYFRWFDENNRLLFLWTPSNDKFEFGVGADESFRSGGNIVPYFTGRVSGFDRMQFLGKVSSLTGYIDYTPTQMLKDIVCHKRLNCAKAIRALTAYCQQQKDEYNITGAIPDLSYSSTSNYFIIGNFGFLGAEQGDRTSTSITVSETPYPYVFLNTAKSSYYIQASGTMKTTTSNATGTTLTAYIPSYRFAYDYYDTADPFTEQVDYIGKKPVPVKTNSTISADVLAREAGAVLYDNTYSTKQEYLNGSNYYKQWPSVRTTGGTRYGDIYVAGDKSWLAFIDDISTLNWTDSSNADPAAEYKFIKRCNFHCFNTNENIGALNGNGFIVPYGYTPAGTIGSCINGVASGDNGVIRTPRMNSNVMNLCRIHNLRFDVEEMVTDSANTSAYYSLKWGYTGTDGVEEHTLATLGTIKIQRVNSNGSLTAIYANGDKVVSTDGNVATKRNGHRLEKICITNPNSVYFDAFTATSKFSSFLNYSGSNVQTGVSEFFDAHNRTLSGSELYFGESGLFNEAETPVNFDSLGTTAYAKTTESTDGKTIYNVFDSIDWDVSVAPKLDDATKTALSNIGITNVNALPIPGSLKSGWYIWLDKTTSTSVDPNIKLEILDCKGLTDDGVWIDCRLPDVTELSKNSAGGYVQPSSASIDAIFDSNSVRFSRVKVRFRMVCEGNSVPLNKNGYAVHLGFSIKNEAGGTKDFQKLHTNYINPLVKGCDNIGNIEVTTGRTYYCAVDRRRNLEKNAFGIVYGKSVSSPNNMVVAIGIDNAIKTVSAWLPSSTHITNHIWRITDTETTEHAMPSIPQPSNTAGEMLYYIKSTWVEENRPVSDVILCKVTHSVGTYFKSKCTGNFDFDITGSSFTFRDTVGWNESGKFYCAVTDENVGSLDVATATYSASRKDSQIAIFDIDTAMSSNEVAVHVVGNIKDGDRYTLRVGSMEAAEVVFTNGSDPYIANIDKNRMLEDPDKNKYTRIIITKDGDMASEVPLSYASMIIDNAGKVTFGVDYYETTGGVMVRFRDYKKFNVKATVKKTPDLENIETGYPTEEMFYIVNGFKNLSFGSVCEIERDNTVPIDPLNNLSLNSTKTEWIAEWHESGSDQAKWRTPEGMLVSTNSNQAVMRLIADNSGTEIGKVKYKTIDNILLFVGEISYTYDIKIGGSIRKRVTERLQDIVSGSFYPIRVCTEPILYFMNNVVKYTSPIFVINETDNTFVGLSDNNPVKNIYSHFEISTSLGETWGPIPANSKTWVKCGNFSTDTEVLASFFGRLTGDWVKNDERLQFITGSNQLVLHVINGKEYDEEVTRVIGGYKLKYPHSRESILFSPNEWVTADNLNIRFQKIAENLKYFEKQTKFYLRPPAMYCGYYGDFEAKIQGSFSRVHGGFVSLQNKLIYKNYNENNSIDDNETYLKNCVSIAASKPFADDCKTDEDGHMVTTLTEDDIDNNLYVCLGDKIRILGQSTFAENTARNDIIPKRTNEFMNYITRIFYSNETHLLYCLSPKTHKIYMFNRYKHSNNGIGDPQNASYYGEIGGYGGPTANNKFNNPNDFFVSSIKNKDDEISDEIWVCDGNNRVIKHFTIKGQWINTIDLTSIDYDILGVCVDYQNQVHVLTNDYVFTFTSDGQIIRVFELRSNGQTPLMIRPQYKAGFLYVLYEHRISKYDFTGKFIADFAENDELTYTCICPSKEHDIFIGTNKNILQYSDVLRVATIGATKNAHDFCWSLKEIFLNKNENIQDAVLNTSMQRMYDNIRMFSLCAFGRVIDTVVDNNDNEVADFDKNIADAILKQHHKEQIFVGINELVTLDVINRSFNQMYDLLDLMLKSI